MQRRAIPAAVTTHSLVVLVAVASARVAETPDSGRSFNRASWLAAYGALRVALQRTYSNLAWYASPGGGRDLPALNRQTLAALMAATDDRSARLARSLGIGLRRPALFRAVQFYEGAYTYCAQAGMNLVIGFLGFSRRCPSVPRHWGSCEIRHRQLTMMRS